MGSTPSDRWHAVDLSGAGLPLRLDLALAGALGLPRRAVWRMLEAGAVRVNSRVARPADKRLIITASDAVMVAEDDASHTIITEPDAPLSVLAQGPGWVAVDKPAGQAVHPLKADERGTVLNALAARYPQVIGVGEGGLRSGVVHRLDVPTSGVLLFALDQTTWQRLRRAFSEHRVDKRYLALVHGQLQQAGEATMRLAVTRHKPARVSVVGERDPRGRACSLGWRVLRRDDRGTLLEVKLETGHLHQVRVMMAAMGHAVVGDALYGDPLHSDDTDERLMLHAWSARFEEIEAVSKPPIDVLRIDGR